MKFSIIMPVYNEQSTIVQVYNELLALPFDKQIIIVDDGSNDGSAELLNNLDFTNTSTETKLIRHKKNLGKGKAIRSALPYLNGDYVVIQDADLEVSTEEYHKFHDFLLTNPGAIIYGSRFKKTPANNIKFKTILVNRLISCAVLALYGRWISDEATAYKIIPVKLFQEFNLQSKRFEICAEITAKILRQKLQITELPIGYYPRSKADGKKLNYFKDGLKTFLTLIKYRFDFASRINLASLKFSEAFPPPVIFLISLHGIAWAALIALIKI